MCIRDRDNNVLMDGRDIGTVVLPGAQVKIFLTASAGDRARRRYDELIARGEWVSYEPVSYTHLAQKQRTHGVKERRDQERLFGVLAEGCAVQRGGAFVADHTLFGIALDGHEKRAAQPVAQHLSLIHI